MVASLAFRSYTVWYSPWRRIGSSGVAPEGSSPLGFTHQPIIYY